MPRTVSDAKYEYVSFQKKNETLNEISRHTNFDGLEWLGGASSVPRDKGRGEGEKGTPPSPCYGSHGLPIVLAVVVEVERGGLSIL
jgi:hypothetical protein